MLRRGIIIDMTAETPEPGTQEQAADPSQDAGITTTADDSAGETVAHVHEEVDVDYDVEVPNVRPGARTGLDHDELRAKPSTLAGRAKPPGIPANEPPETDAADPDVVAEEDQPVPTGDAAPVAPDTAEETPETQDAAATGDGSGDADGTVNPAMESPQEVLHDAVTPSGADLDGGVVVEDTTDSPEPAASTPDEGAAETSSGESAAAGASATEPAPAADATEDDEKRPPPTSPPA